LGLQSYKGHHSGSNDRESMPCSIAFPFRYLGCPSQGNCGSPHRGAVSASLARGYATSAPPPNGADSSRINRLRSHPLDGRPIFEATVRSSYFPSPICLSIYGISNRSLFALAKRWQIYTLDGDEGLPWGGGTPASPA